MLQFHSIMAKPNMRKIKSALKDLPEELDLMYDQAFERIKNQDPEFASLVRKFIYWTLFAIRPLNVQELRHAVAVELGDISFDEEGLPYGDLIESVCAGLLTFQEDDTVALFVSEEDLEQVVLGLLLLNDQLRASVQAAQVTKSRYPLWSQDFPKDVSGLWLAPSYGLLRICTEFVEGGANPSECDFLGHTPLHRAVIHDSVGLVRLLLDHNVDIEALSLDVNRTPLHWAAWPGHTGVISLLITRRALVKSRDQQKWTALHVGASQSHQEIVDLLLREKIEIDAKDGYGATTLYRAAEGGHEAAAQLLLIEVARTDIPNDYDQTPLHRAADLGWLATARLLLNHGVPYDVKNVVSATH
ncbi:MAG: hypothetical protein Q9180_005829 [Flavoplaca navasiana]